MKPLSCLISAVLVCGSLSGQTPDTAKMVNIEEIMKLSKVDQLQPQIFAQMRTMMKVQLEKMPEHPQETSEMQEIQDRVFTLISDRLSWAKMKPQLLALYDETFTTQEVAGILDFYRSPAGAAMIEKMPLLMSKSMTLGQTLMGDFVPDVQRIMEEVRTKHNNDGTSAK